MSMVPSDFSFPQVLAELVANNTIPESRLDESVRRILQLKIDVGLFENTVTPPQLMGRVLGGPADQQKSLDIARQSITLLQNVAAPGTGGKPVLPLSPWVECGGMVLVVGPAMDSLADQCGGWSLQWGGATTCQFQAGIGMTVLQGITLQASSRGIASQGYQGVTFTTANQANLTEVAQLAAQATVVVMVIGEAPESETPGDTTDLSISPSQTALFQAVNATGKPIVTVLIEPRPRVLGPIADGSAAILMAYLPCLHGGQAIAEVLFGEINPSGRLPLTYPRTTGDLDVYFHKPWNASYEGLPESTYHNPLFTFGSGFGYSPLNYSNLQLSPSVASPNQAVIVTVNISNVGQYDANETVLVFVRQLYRSAISPENMLLKGFTKVFIPAGQSIVASVTLNTASFAYWTPALESVVDAGNYAITVDSLSAQLVIQTSSEKEGVPDTSSALNLPARLKGAEMDQLVEEMMKELREAEIRASGPISRDTTFADLRARIRKVLTRV
jgi:beta-glucosidase